ncbi:helix-turn-helix domain-containing protein [Streptomyces sp. WAC06614]|uniref:helix-turn-helix domain-containing protein n=1 Tax=Streptomyces sp. WAC06614 TaxID=2487416 RepID=UPI00163C047D|nr:helix-turn-helix domain-containing protein [Streptomyces sp. WAC06614]
MLRYSQRHDADVVRLAQSVSGRANAAVQRSRLPAPSRPLELVEEVVRLERDLAELKAVAVRQAAEYGATWSDIGHVLAMSPSHARAKFSDDNVAKVLQWRAGRGSAPGPRPPRVRPPRPASPVAGRQEEHGPSSPALPGHPGYQLTTALSHLQRSSGRTQRWLADEVGVSPSLLSRILLGRRTPKWNVVKAIAESCGADPADLRPLWEKALGIVPVELPGPEDFLQAAAALKASLRGMWLAAGTPLPQALCFHHPLLTPGRVRRALVTGRPETDLADWPFVAALATALRGQPEDLHPLWKRMQVAASAFLTPLGAAAQGEAYEPAYGGSEDLPYGGSDDVPYGGSDDVPYGGSDNVPYGGSDDVPYEASDELRYGASEGLPNGASGGLPNGASGGLPSGASGGLPYEASDGPPVAYAGAGAGPGRAPARAPGPARAPAPGLRARRASGPAGASSAPGPSGARGAPRPSGAPAAPGPSRTSAAQPAGADPAPHPAGGQALRVPRARPSTTAAARNADADAVRRRREILEVLRASDTPVGLASLARSSGLPLPQAAEVLSWLREHHFTEGRDGGHAAGPVLRAFADGRNVVQEYLEGLSRQTRGAIYIGSYLEGEVHVSHEAAEPGIPTVHQWVDFRESAHASAVGKATLAQLDREARLDHLSRYEPAALTPHTITNADDLLRSLDLTTVQYDLTEYSDRTICAASPLTLPGLTTCIAVALPVTERRRLNQAITPLKDPATTMALSLMLTLGP